MNDQFSFSEHEGFLRVVTEDCSKVRAISEASSPFSRTQGEQARPIGRVGNIGRGEDIYAVRMFGDVGFVVTFLNTDPLLHARSLEPANPRVVGELEIPGYSAYLHPVAANRLIGVGSEPTADGIRRPAPSSPSSTSPTPRTRPTRAGRSCRSSFSEAEYDHHAFLYWPDPAGFRR